MNYGWIVVRCRYNEWEWRNLVPKRKGKESYSISNSISSLSRLAVKWRRFLVVSGKTNPQIALQRSAVLAQLRNTKKDRTTHVVAKESSLNNLNNMHHPATKQTSPIS